MTEALLLLSLAPVPIAVKTDCHIFVEKRFVGVQLDTFQKGGREALLLSLFGHMLIWLCFTCPNGSCRHMPMDGIKGNGFTL